MWSVEEPQVAARLRPPESPSGREVLVQGGEDAQNPQIGFGERERHAGELLARDVGEHGSEASESIYELGSVSTG